MMGDEDLRYPTDDVVEVCQMGLAFLAPEYLVGRQVDVV
jgi:hypothetical protein